MPVDARIDGEIGEPDLFLRRDLAGQDRFEFFFRHAGAGQHAAALQGRAAMHHQDRVAARVAAGFEQQGNIEHDERNTAPGAGREKFFFRAPDQGMEDRFQAPDRRVVAEHLGAQGLTVDGAVFHHPRKGRADRRDRPETALPTAAITPHLGWCDDPASPAYNRLVRLPCPWRHEVLARADGLYDLMVVLGHNDAPPAPGAGSAIFLHLATSDYAPTEGCVALAEADLVDLLRAASPGDVMTVRG